MVRDDADKTEDKAEVYEVESDDDHRLRHDEYRRHPPVPPAHQVAFHRGELTHLRLKFPHTSAMRRLS